MSWACELKPPKQTSIFKMTADVSTDVLAPYSKGNLDSTDFYRILEGLGVSKQDSTKLQDEYGGWNIIMYESMEELKIKFRKLNLYRKTSEPTLTARGPSSIFITSLYYL